MNAKIAIPADSEAAVLVADLIDLRTEFRVETNSWDRTDHLTFQAGKKAWALLELLEIVP